MGLQDTQQALYPVNMRLQRDGGAALEFVHATLGIWLGIYAFRAFVAAAVWNLSDSLPLFWKGALAIGVHLLGLAGCALPIVRRPGATARLALAAAAAGVLRQLFIAHDVWGSALSLAGWVLWLWWLAGLARSARNERTGELAAGLLAAFGFQVGMQAAWHGLDLPMARGVWAVGAALLLHGLFAWAGAARSEQPDATEPRSTRFFAALGIAFFLELTLLANPGRIASMTGLGLVPTALLIQLGLLLGMLAVSFRQSRTLAAGALTVLLAVLLGAPQLRASAAALSIVAQVALAIVVLHAAARGARSWVMPFLAGAIGLFVLVFLFYNRYEWPPLWPLAGVLLGLIAWPMSAAAPARRTYALWALSACALTLTALAPGGASEVVAHASARLRVATYNIHQGFDAAGVPAMQEIAAEIAALDADVVALQEVGRGWTLLGGADLVAYLKHRFPNYDIHFVPVNGRLWGVALLSRLPLYAAGGRAFAATDGVFKYGYADATVRLDGSAVRVVSVHLAAGLEGDGEDARTAQAEQLLESVEDHPTAVIAGDLNTLPQEAPLQSILAAGYHDAAAAAGLSQMQTWPAHAPNQRIDYVLVKGVGPVVSGTVSASTASDHRPVVVTLSMKARDR